MSNSLESAKEEGDEKADVGTVVSSMSRVEVREIFGLVLVSASVSSWVDAAAVEAEGAPGSGLAKAFELRMINPRTSRCTVRPGSAVTICSL